MRSLLTSVLAASTACAQFSFATLVPGASPLLGNFGLVDVNGRAQVDFLLPAGANPAPVGVVL